MAEDEYTRQFDIVIEYVPWRGDSPSTTVQAITQFTQAIYVDGHLMTFKQWAADSNGGPVDCGADLEMHGFMELRLRHLDDEPFDLLNVTADDWMEDGTRENFSIPVGKLAIRQAVFHGSRAGSF